MEKNIQVCGIGNGLVDYQFEVDDKIITELGVNKGEMALVDVQRQAQIIHSLSPYNFNKCSGGSAANTIIAFAKFGGKAAYQTVLGNDENGFFYANEFKDLGIELSAGTLDNYPTGSCLVLITPDSERTMMTSLGASSLFNPSRVDSALIERSEWLYIEGYEFSQQESSNAVYDAIEKAKSAGTKIALTFSDVFITEIFKDKAAKAAYSADLIFANENEAYSFTGKTNLTEAIAELSKIAPNLAVTLGAKGSIIKWDGTIFQIPAYKASPVDTTGAGDMYAGAFLYGLMETGDPVKSGHLASYASSRIVSSLGARLKEDHKELKEYIFSNILM